MKLLDDYRQILSRAWSVRWLIVAGLLSGAEVALQIAQPVIEPLIPRGLFSALAGLATAAALVARVLAQSNLPPQS